MSHATEQLVTRQPLSCTGEWKAGQPKWVAPLEIDEKGDPLDDRGAAVGQAMDAARLARSAGLRCAAFAREYAREDGVMQVGQEPLL